MHAAAVHRETPASTATESELAGAELPSEDRRRSQWLRSGHYNLLFIFQCFVSVHSLSQSRLALAQQPQSPFPSHPFRDQN